MSTHMNWETSWVKRICPHKLNIHLTCDGYIIQIYICVFMCDFFTFTYVYIYIKKDVSWFLKETEDPNNSQSLTSQHKEPATVPADDLGLIGRCCV